MSPQGPPRECILLNGEMMLRLYIGSHMMNIGSVQRKTERLDGNDDAGPTGYDVEQLAEDRMMWRSCVARCVKNA